MQGPEKTSFLTPESGAKVHMCWRQLDRTQYTDHKLIFLFRQQRLTPQNIIGIEIAKNDICWW